MATKAKRKRRQPRGRARSLLAGFGHGAVALARGWPALTPLQQEVVGLGLGAVGLLCALVLYGSLGGGKAGTFLKDASSLLLGQARDLAPLLLLALGATLLLARRAEWARRPWKATLLLFLGALTTTLAALSSAPRGAPRWSLSYLGARGGAPGELLWTAAHGVAGMAGVAVVCAFLWAACLLAVGRVFPALPGKLASLVRSVGGLARGVVVVPSRIPLGEEVAVAQEEAAPAGASSPLAPVGGPARAAAGGDDGEPFAQRWEEGEPPLPPARPAPSPEQLTPAGRYRASVTEDPSFQWQLPDPAAVLVRSAAPPSPDKAALQGQERIAATLLETLGHFGVRAEVIGAVAGPHITRFELRLAPGTKVSKVSQLKDDLAYALAATEIRILAPIPGKQAVGVEVPNPRRRLVHLGDVYGHGPPPASPLTVWLGKDVAGRPVAAELTKMPHLLVAGATGAGKSGAINAMLSCILLQATPHQVRLVLVDPKQVELNHYEGIPHLLTPVITNPRMAATALANLVREMESRYSVMSLARARNLPELNKERARRGEAPFPYILCVIDELADLMMVAPAEVEDSIIRLAQKARAVGIHLLLATQSPRVDVITGMIKANVPSRIAFAVSSQTDSRVILDQNGAESLLGQGDMLFSPMGSSKLVRIQGAYVDEAQIARLTDHWRRQGEPELREELLEAQEEEEEGGEGGDPDFDPLLAEAATLVVEMQTASTSMLQRRLRVGYTRAGRLIDMLERRGIISGYEGSKPRQVLLAPAELERIRRMLEPAGAVSFSGEEEPAQDGT